MTVMPKETASSSTQDVSQVRTPIHISGRPIEQVLNSIHYGSPELRCLLMDECSLIFECKVCRALFRDLPNFISHKRQYCTKSSIDDRHVMVADLPEEKVVVVQPQAPEETESQVMSIKHAKTGRPKLEETIQRIQSGELGRSHAYKVYTEAAEKLQKQKEGMKVATIRTTAIPTNRNAVFIDVNMASVNIHERQQQVNGSSSSASESGRGHKNGVIVSRKANEKLGSLTPRSSRHTRKSLRQARHSSEPQKLLMEQLKEIQHKVRQRAAVQEKGRHQKLVQDKIAQQKAIPRRQSMEKTVQDKMSHRKDEGKDKPQNIKVKDIASAGSDSQKNSLVLPKKESSSKIGANVNETQPQRKKSQEPDLKNLARQNLQSLLAKAEKRSEANSEGSPPDKLKGRDISKIHPRLIQNNLNAVKAISMSRRKISKSLICSKCNSIFATRKSLGFHMKIHHSQNRTFYPCPYCSSTFYYFFGITRHLFNSHSKSMKEIDAMRKQLRDISYTKQLTPAPKNITHTPAGFRRSARAFARKCAVTPGSLRSDMVDMSPVSEMQLSKKKDKTVANSVSNSPAKLQMKKEPVSTPKPKSEPGVSQGSKSDKKTDSSSKESTVESRADRLKNRQLQQKAQLHLAGNVSDLSHETPSLRCVASATGVSESGNENSYVCSKCERSFGRKLSYESHLKVCQGLGSSTTSGEKDNKSQLNEKPTIVDNPTSNSLDSGMVTKTASKRSPSLVLTRNTDLRSSRTRVSDSTKTPEIMNVSMRSRRLDRSSDSHSSRNSSVTSSTDRSSSLTQRSASVDRGLQQGQRRNRSLERGRSSKRDSSVESTQSNVELRSSRSQRNVHSRYSTSPGLIKNSQPQAVQDIKGSFHRKLEKNYLHLSHMSTRGKTSESKERDTFAGKKEHQSESAASKSTQESPTSIKPASAANSGLSSTHMATKNSPYRINFIKNVGQIKHSSGVNTRLVVNRRTRHGTSLSSEAYFSPKRSSSGIPRRISLSPQLGNRTNLKSPPQQSISSVKSEPNEKTQEQLSERNISSNSLANVAEKLITVKMETGSNSSTSAGNAQNGSQSNESQIMETIVLNQNDQKSQQVEIKTVDEVKQKTRADTARLNVISALSERPRRKRKIPSRNLDAEEMLSKIHNRDQEPTKRIKIAQDAKESQKKDREAKDKLNNDVSKNPEQDGGEHYTDSLEEVGHRTAPGGDTFDHGDGESDGDGEAEQDEDDQEGSEKGTKSRGRLASNRIYVLEKVGNNARKLKCYDLTFTHKFMDSSKLKCLVCGEKLTQWYNLRRHVIRNHLKWSRFMCKLCKFESYDRSECNTHILRTHRIKSSVTVNSLIIDLVKQGSKARSLKKNQTIQVKRKSESEAGNIYARPMMKKMPRLPQRVRDNVTRSVDSSPNKSTLSEAVTPLESSGSSETGESAGNQKSNLEKARQDLTSSLKSSDTKSSQSKDSLVKYVDDNKSEDSTSKTAVQESQVSKHSESQTVVKHTGAISTEIKSGIAQIFLHTGNTEVGKSLPNNVIKSENVAEKKSQTAVDRSDESVTEKFTRDSKKSMEITNAPVETKTDVIGDAGHSSQSSSSTASTSPKPGTDSTSAKAVRHQRPFNISTRRVPRVFDIRPYRPESDEESQESEGDPSSKIDSKPRTEKGFFAKVIKTDQDTGVQLVVKNKKKRPRSEKGTFIKVTDTTLSADDQAWQSDDAMTDNSEASGPSFRDRTPGSRNIFDNMRRQSLSSEASYNAEDSLDNAGLVPVTYTVQVNENTTDNVLPNTSEKSTECDSKTSAEKPVVVSQGEDKVVSEMAKTSFGTPGQPPKPETSNNSNTPQYITAVTSSEYAQYNQLAKSLSKLKELGDQLTSVSATNSPPVSTTTPFVIRSATVIRPITPTLSVKVESQPVSHSSTIVTSSQNSSLQETEAQVQTVESKSSNSKAKPQGTSVSSPSPTHH